MSLALLLAGGTAQAQRALRGTRGIELSGGMADGFHRKDSGGGYWLGVGMSSYAKGANQWVFSVEYLNRKYPYKDGSIPLAQFTGAGGYYFNFLSDASKTLFLYLGGSAMAGYETVNWGERLLEDGAKIRNKDGFLWGGAVTLRIETYLSDRVILLITGRERFLWGTTTGHFHTQVGVGLKFIIN